MTPTRARVLREVIGGRVEYDPRYDLAFSLTAGPVNDTVQVMRAAGWVTLVRGRKPRWQATTAGRDALAAHDRPGGAR